ncbi:MAG: hypothetical protein ACKO0X_06550 [Bacteroidota bacterium]
MRTLLLSFLCFILLDTVSMATPVPDSVFARLDTNAILLGQQVKLKISYQGNTKSKVVFPAVADTFSNLEVVERLPIDTIRKEGEPLTLTQSFIITGFDSGYQVILPFEILFLGPKSTDTSSLFTQPLLISVQSVPVDTTKSIKDIKNIEAVPFSIWDHIGWIILAIAAFVGFILWKKYGSKLKSNTPALTQAPSIPCHEKALMALDELNKKQLWQNGQYRQYHTELTDILRSYISDRWEVGALEMTTDEILVLTFIPSNEVDGIGYVLRLADMVKFAKGVPHGDENIRCMDVTRRFIQENKDGKNELLEKSA